jgi:hypothetical protein
MDIVAVESTNLFIGSETAPRQVVRIVLRGTQGASGQPAQVRRAHEHTDLFASRDTLQLGIEAQSNPVADEVSALTAVVRPILEATLTRSRWISFKPPEATRTSA